MHWWTQAMVAAHRVERGRVAEVGRRVLEKCGIIHDMGEMLRRLKMVGAGNMPAFRADRTFYFLNDGEVLEEVVEMDRKDCKVIVR